MRIVLHEFVQATADSNGRAAAEIGPHRYGERWEIELIYTSTNSIQQSRLKVYRGVESESARILGSYSGNDDTASGGTTKLQAGERLLFVWTNADPGALCTARLEGEFISQRW